MKEINDFFYFVGILQNTLGEYSTSSWSQLGLDNVTTFIPHFTVIFQFGTSGKNYSVKSDYEKEPISAICEHG